MRRAFAVALPLIACAVFAGCARTGHAKVAIASADSSPGGLADSPAGDIRRGGLVFVRTCSACHGATGKEGGSGPSLRGESGRQTPGATVAWIKHPDPPMPKLYPVPLSRRDVTDVAAYVQSL